MSPSGVSQRGSCFLSGGVDRYGDGVGCRPAVFSTREVRFLAPQPGCQQSPNSVQPTVTASPSRQLLLYRVRWPRLSGKPLADSPCTDRLPSSRMMAT
jgi:hypothetical protein